MTALARLVRVKGGDRPAILLTPVNAILQRVPPRETLSRQSLSAAPGNLLAMSGVVQWLEVNGFTRAGTVREAGDYAVRGGIVDLFAPGMGDPVRLDFFGDTLESIAFDPETQRTNAELRTLDLVPMAEFQLTTETVRMFRTGYVAAFGAAAPDDILYEAVSKGRRVAGVEHWLPLFHRQLETLFDYLDATPLAIEPLAEEAAHERLAQIGDYYQARMRGCVRSSARPRGKRRAVQAAAAGSALSGRGRMARTASTERGAGAAVRRLRRRTGGGDRDRDRHAYPATTSPPSAASPMPTCSTRCESHVGNAANRRQARHRRDVERGLARAHGAMCSPSMGFLTRAPVASWPDALALPRHQIGLAVLGIDAPASRPPTQPSSPKRTFSANAWCARAGNRSGRRISSPR